MVSWLRPRRSAITFDVGAAGIRVCQFQRRGGRLTPCDTLTVGGAPLSGDDPPAALSLDPAQLQRLIGRGSFRGRAVALVLSPPEVQFFPLRLPPAALAQPPERVNQALQYEVAQQSRQSADALEVRHWCLPGGRGQTANVMAVALPTESVRRWCLEFARHGLRLRRVDVSPCALLRLARQAWTPAAHDVWGVLDLGLRRSVLTAAVGAVPTYVRTLSLGTHDWTKRLAQAFEVGYAVAEQLKREHGWQAAERGIGRTPRTGNLLQAADVAAAVASVLREPLQVMCAEISRCFAYVLQSYPEAAVQRLYLAGGGAALRGLPALLAAELNMPVLPLTHTTEAEAAAWEQPLSGARIEPQAASAAGGAMLELEES